MEITQTRGDFQCSMPLKTHIIPESREIMLVYDLIPLCP